VVVIRPVAIKAKASISIWGSGVDPGTAAYIRIPPVDIYIPAIVNIDIGIPAALVHIYPIVGVAVPAYPVVGVAVPIPVTGTGDIGGAVPGRSVDRLASVCCGGLISCIGSTPVRG
jgi:hypothetical protein